MVRVFIRKAQSIVKAACHTGHSLFSLLLSKTRYMSLKAQMSIFRIFFFTTAIRLLNQLPYIPFSVLLPRTVTLNSASFAYCVIVFNYFGMLHNLVPFCHFVLVIVFIMTLCTLITLSSCKQGVSLHTGVYDNRLNWIWIILFSSTKKSLSLVEYYSLI